MTSSKAYISFGISITEEFTMRILKEGNASESRRLENGAKYQFFLVFGCLGVCVSVVLVIVINNNNKILK